MCKRLAKPVYVYLNRKAMKKIFTKIIYALAAIFLLVGITVPAFAQYTENTITTNAGVTAIAKDNNGNTYAIENPSQNNSSGQIVEYAAGSGTKTVIYSGTLISNEDDLNEFAY